MEVLCMVQTDEEKREGDKELESVHCEEREPNKHTQKGVSPALENQKGEKAKDNGKKEKKKEPQLNATPNEIALVVTAKSRHTKEPASAKPQNTKQSSGKFTGREFSL